MMVLKNIKKPASKLDEALMAALRVTAARKMLEEATRELDEAIAACNELGHVAAEELAAEVVRLRHPK